MITKHVTKKKKSLKWYSKKTVVINYFLKLETLLQLIICVTTNLRYILRALVSLIT